MGERACAQPQESPPPSHTSTAVVVFARLPVPGQVKTRLAAGVGPANAAKFYKACAEHVISQAAAVAADPAAATAGAAGVADEGDAAQLQRQQQRRDSNQAASSSSSDETNEVDETNTTTTTSSSSGGGGVRVVVYHTNASGEDGPAVRAWLDSAGLGAVGTAPQANDPDLGERMLRALRSEIDKGAQHVVVVGTDVPGLTARVIARALRLLESHQLVLGPAADGGYYLLGASSGDALHPSLFYDMAWSTPSVRAETLRRAAAAELSVVAAAGERVAGSAGAAAAVGAAAAGVGAGARAAGEGGESGGGVFSGGGGEEGDAAMPVLRDIDTVDDLREWTAQAQAAEEEAVAAAAMQRHQRQQQQGQLEPAALPLQGRHPLLDVALEVLSSSSSGGRYELLTC